MAGLQPTDPIERLLGDPVATIKPTATLREAAVALAADRIGLLVVVDPAGVRGVLSERDIINAIAEDLDLDTERVRDMASTDVLTVDESASIMDAAREMLAAEIRHLAVARRGVIYDVVSIRDLVGVLVDAADATA